MQTLQWRGPGAVRRELGQTSEGQPPHVADELRRSRGVVLHPSVRMGRGVTIHTKDCSRVLDYDPARRVHVRWDTATQQVRPVNIQVFASDAPGLLASMSQCFHSAGVNITAVNCKTTEDHRAINNFTFLVSDVEQLKRVMRDIERISGVSSVERLIS